MMQQYKGGARELIEYLRWYRNVNIVEITKKTGIPISTLSSHLTGKATKMRNKNYILLESLAESYGFSIHYSDFIRSFNERDAGADKGKIPVVGESPRGGYAGADADLTEIINTLKGNPESKKAVLKLLRGQKEITEAMEYFQKPGGKKA